jgi:hyaluronan synthase
MFIGLLQLRHSFTHDTRLYLFSIFVLLTWAVWMVKVMISRRYRPWTEPFATSTSVIIPVVDEPLELFRDVLARIVEQRPSQVLVVINGPRNRDLELVCEEFGELVEHTWTPIPGKRNAVRVGVEHCTGDVVMLVDSDTIWTDGTHDELVKPFADPKIGGVTTRQRILEPDRSFYTRWADWLENSRALYSMPAQSVLGTIGCLPGRTIAFRRQILIDAMPAFMTQKFLGVFLEVSDDRTLTNLTLKQGYRTVYQSTSLVYTDAPTQFRKLTKQQFRWSRGSQYNTLRMLPWMIRRAPLLAFFFVADIVLPFLWFCSAVAWAARAVTHTGSDLYAGLLTTGREHALIAVITLTIVTSTLSMCVRQHRHLSEVNGDVIRMPFYILFSSLVLMPIRLWGFIRLAHAGGWGTRANAYSGSDDDALPALTGGVLEPEFASAGGSSAPPGAKNMQHLSDPRRSQLAVWEGAGDVTDVEGVDPEVAEQSARSVLDERQKTRARARGWHLPNLRIALPYLIASALLLGGIFYDIRPV